MVKIFPHTDMVAQAYWASFDDLTDANTKAILGKYLHVSDLRSLVKSFGNMTGGVNYADQNLNTLLTRINRKDVSVVVLYGIHTSGNDAYPHVTVQQSCDTTEAGWNNLCHFYVEQHLKSRSYVWRKELPPTWLLNDDKAKTLLYGKQLI